MSSKDETLGKLTQARGAYKSTVAQIDAELAKERERLLSVAQGTIVHLICEAYVQGASINAIKAAYGTRDFYTIKNVLKDNQVYIESLQATATPEAAPQEESSWFQVKDDTVLIYGSNLTPVEFGIIKLEGNSFMLDAFDEIPDPELATWDGFVLEGDRVSQNKQVRELTSAVVEANRES